MNNASQIDSLIEAATNVIERVIPDDELHDLKPLGIDNEKNPGITALLTDIGVIQTVQRTSRVYIGKFEKDAAVQSAQKLGSAITAVSEKLPRATDGTLSRSEILRILQDNSVGSESYATVGVILSVLGLAISAGRSRTGGFQCYDRNQTSKQIEEAENEIRASKSDEGREAIARKHESILYPEAEKLIATLGFQAKILGQLRRLRGEWSTPDIIGYRVNRYQTLLGGEPEVISIEVKWSISKLAIAEAHAHQRFTHRTYLMVHQPIEDIDETHLLDLSEKGIGLICLNNKEYRFQTRAAYNTLLATNLDSFLTEALLEEKAVLREELAAAFFKDICFDSMQRIVKP